MLHWLSRQEAPRPSHPGANGALAWFVFLPVLAMLSSPSFLVAAPAESSSLPNAGFWSGFLLGCFLLVIVAFLVRMRLKVVRQELQKARELADHREYERNLAQQERSEEHTSELQSLRH